MPTCTHVYIYICIYTYIHTYEKVDLTHHIISQSIKYQRPIDNTSKFEPSSWVTCGFPGRPFEGAARLQTKASKHEGMGFLGKSHRQSENN